MLPAGTAYSIYTIVNWRKATHYAHAMSVCDRGQDVRLGGGPHMSETVRDHSRYHALGALFPGGSAHCLLESMRIRGTLIT
jgi:hypothetical protein